MKHAAIILSLILALSGCSRHLASVVDNKAVHSQSDSVRIVDRLVSVPYAVPGDTMRVLVPVDCDSLGRVRASGLSATGSRAGIHVVFEKATTSAPASFAIEADCNAYIDSLHITQRTVSELRQRYDSVATYRKDTIRVQYIPGIYKAALAAWILLILAAMVYAGVKLYLKFKP